MLTIDRYLATGWEDNRVKCICDDDRFRVETIERQADGKPIKHAACPSCNEQLAVTRYDVAIRLEVSGELP